jgi:hypothetical protein
LYSHGIAVDLATETLDYWKWAAHEDLVSDDAHPDPADPRAHANAALNYLRAAGVRPVLDVPGGVKATVRRGERATYLFVLNHNDHHTRTPLSGPYAAGGTDLLTGARVRDHVDLGPLGAAVLRIATTDSLGETRT